MSSWVYAGSLIFVDYDGIPFLTTALNRTTILARCLFKAGSCLIPHILRVLVDKRDSSRSGASFQVFWFSAM